MKAGKDSQLLPPYECMPWLIFVYVTLTLVKSIFLKLSINKIRVS